MQDLGFGGLWVSKVHHFIQQLVDDDKVVPYTFLLEFFEVLRKYFHHLVQKEENFSRICVSFCKCKEVEIVVADVEIVDAFAGKAWWDGGALVFGLTEQDRKFLDR